MTTGYYQSPGAIIDFATRYYDDLNRIVGNRMRQLGIPDEMIGIKGWPGIDEGPFVRFPDTQIGGNSNSHVHPHRPGGIALDHGIFDAAHPDMTRVLTWARAAVRDGMDAAIVHEYLEATLTPPLQLKGEAAADWLHEAAIRLAPNTTLSITRKARDILTEYRQIEELIP